MNSNIKYSKKDNRRLSEFLAKEMMYDYVKGRLDLERTKAMDLFLKDFPEYKQVKKQIELGIEYCNDLKQIQMTPQLYEQIQSSDSILEKSGKLLKINQWPMPLKWTVQISLICGLIVVLVYSFMGHYLNWLQDREQITIAEIIKTDSSAEVVSTDENEIDSELKEIYMVKHEAESNLQIEKKEKQAHSKTLNSNATQTILSKEKPESSDQAELIQIKDNDNIVPPKANESFPSKQGYVYRLILVHSSVDKITPELVSIIHSYGGEKAGQVPLGWEKESGRYFHFSIQEKNYDQFVTDIKKYGNWVIKKDKHERIMPAGVARLILWIEQDNSAIERE